MKLFILICSVSFCYSLREDSSRLLKKRSVEPSDIPSPETAPDSSPSILPGGHLYQSLPSDVVCCECVPFFLCENGTIVTDGSGALDLRIGGVTPSPPVQNVEVCPDPMNLCCLIPDVNPVCLGESPTTKSPETFFTPPPDSSCECLSYTACDPQLVVSDGLGLTSIELSNGRLINHSQCAHALDVCCYLPDIIIDTTPTTLTSPTTPPSSENPNPTCECVPPFLCGPDGYLITDGVGVIDLRIGGPSVKPKPCPQNPNLVCCLSKPPLLNSTTVAPTEPPPPALLCGQRNYNGIGVRILGFKEGQTQFAEFPWVATLLKKEFMEGEDVPLFVGGASLIHRRVVMTAAHKIKGIEAHNLLVRLGEWDVASTKESLPYQNVDVEKVIIHPRYTPGPLFHDIALLILKESAKLDFHINPICPAKSVDSIIPSTCVVNGWGVDAYRSNNYQNIMKSVRLPLVRNKKCQTMLRKTRLSRFFNLHRSFICAGGEEGIDACKGDGGGPLSCQTRDDPSRYLQVGITAWGIGCGGKDVPGVYADVVVHYPWIMKQVHEHFPEGNRTESDSSTTTGTESSSLTAQENREKRKQKRKEERRRQRQQARRNKNQGQ